MYIRDSGLLHALLSIADLDSLLGHPILGASWEGFVIEQVIAALPVGWQPFFFRTSSGAEVDLVLSKPGSAPVAVEIKAGSAPHLERGFRNAFSDLGCRRGFCIYNGDEEYPLMPQVLALPLTHVSKIFEPA